MKLRDLIRKLREDKVDDHYKDVEFIICTTDGEILCMEMAGQAQNVVKALKLFGGKLTDSRKAGG